jgi:hypothetical protein
MGGEGEVDTRPCRQCGCIHAAKVRESIAGHGRRQYTMRWYLCPDCRDVNFTYQVREAPLGAPPATQVASEAAEISAVAEASAVTP